MGNICCCFGHRRIYGGISDKLYSVLENLIIQDRVKIFMTGGMGEFDLKFAGTVKILKKKHPDIRLMLIIPYLTEEINESKGYCEKMYDEIIIPSAISQSSDQKKKPLDGGKKQYYRFIC